MQPNPYQIKNFVECPKCKVSRRKSITECPVCNQVHFIVERKKRDYGNFDNRKEFVKQVLMVSQQKFCFVRKPKHKEIAEMLGVSLPKVEWILKNKYRKKHQ